VRIRFHIDPETGMPHIHRHGVHEDEAEDDLSTPGENRPGKEGSWIAIGQTVGGDIYVSFMCQTPIRTASS
jgi:hypothetical protein